MAPDSIVLIDRERELAALTSALSAAREGRGGLLLVPGEAGVGKTRLVEVALTHDDVLMLAGRTSTQTTPPYGPIVAALRHYLRLGQGDLTWCGPLSHYLPLILPELGVPPNGGDRAALIEAVRGAFECIAVASKSNDRKATVVFLDDLHWADNATFEFLPRLAESLARLPLLVIGAYRSDEIPRGHPMRHLRTELRRLRLLQEVGVEPLDRQATAELAAHTFGHTLSPALMTALFNRTQGIPLFVEELAHALSTSQNIRPGKAGLELTPGHDVPIPETLRDAVLLRLDGLATPARKLLEIASVLGREFDLALACEMVGAEAGDEAGGAAGVDAALDLLLEHNWMTEAQAGRAAFRHGLMHEAIYNQIPWTRRRSWHRDSASRLKLQGAPPEVIAEHWLAARELDLARQALLEFAETSCGLHAYRDAAIAIRRALELWPKGVEETRRLDALDQLGRCAQRAGLLNDAIQAWREVADHRQQDSDKSVLAQIYRQLATAYELQGAWDQVLMARQMTAAAFADSGQPDEAATERLSAAAHLRSAGRFRAALELLSIAREEVEPGQRWDLKARILGHQGNALARMGEYETGLATVRAGLSMALEHNLSGPTAEIYQRLADALEHAGDYAGAKDTYQTAFDFCAMNAAPTMGQICMACLTVVLFHTGEWERAAVICRDVLASADSPQHALTVANTMLGLIYGLRGQISRARPLLLEANAQGRRIELVACELLTTWGFALLDEASGAHESAVAHCRTLLQRWQHTEDRHYAVESLRWSTTRFAALQASTETRACANALATIASTTGHPEALSALAHALGEVSVLEGDFEGAVGQFNQSLELLRNVDSPFEYAETHLRAGLTLLNLNQREAAIEHLVHAYRLAEKLGAKNLADRAARELAALGEKMDQRLGRRAAGKLHHGGLTRRQTEILQLVAQGQTNQDIARALSLSARTVEMHVADILTRLDCHTRTEAAHRAGELGLLKALPHKG